MRIVAVLCLVKSPVVGVLGVQHRLTRRSHAIVSLCIYTNNGNRAQGALTTAEINRLSNWSVNESTKLRGRQ